MPDWLNELVLRPVITVMREALAISAKSRL